MFISHDTERFEAAQQHTRVNKVEIFGVRFDEGAVETGYGQSSEASFHRKRRATDRIDLRMRRHHATLQRERVLNYLPK